MELKIHVLVSVLVVYVLIALGEYTYHRFVAHMMPLRWLRWVPFWRQRCKKHMRHHCRYYRIFNYEPDPVGRFLDLKVTLLTSCIVIVLATVPAYLIDPITGVVAFAGSVMHSVLFNLVHSEVHLNDSRVLREHAVFRYWESQHFLHHLQPDKNFDGVFPLFDRLVGTLAKPTEADLILMRKTLGYVRHHPAGKKQSVA
jgi:sterol desaturase/sphingolipid hydroxylase (fatty acid hydroxylase superfamily)